MQPYGQGSPNGYSPTPPDGRRIWLGDIFVLGGGLFILLFSFAPFVKYPDTVVARLLGSGVTFDGWYTAWSPQMFMAPLSWWPIFAGLGAAAIAIVRMATGKDPEFLRFRAGLVQVGLALCALLVLFGYAVSQKQLGFGLDRFATTTDEIIANNLSRPQFAWGGYLMLLGALAAAVGALLNHFQVGNIRVNLAAQEAPAWTQPPVAQLPTSYLPAANQPLQSYSHYGFNGQVPDYPAAHQAERQSGYEPGRPA